MFIPGDTVVVEKVLSKFEDDKDFAHYIGREGIVNYVGTEMPLKDWENLVSFVDDKGTETLGVFTDDELVLVHRVAVGETTKVGWFGSLRKKFHV